jgi:5,10-methenyltetrahydrofolate synthetase
LWLANSITKQVLKLQEYQDASSLSIFLSMPGKEVSTRDIALDALANKKSVFIPYIHAGTEPKSKVIEMLQVQNENDLYSLKPDAWGIPSLAPETVDDRQNALGGTGIKPESSPLLDLILMPAVAFDRSHSRLGHGMGFYDRYLQTYHKAVENSGGKMPSLSKYPSSFMPMVTNSPTCSSRPRPFATAAPQMGTDTD